MTETLPISRMTREIEELSIKILATVDVRVNEFREQVIGIKNRIEARLTGLQLGAFASPISLAYEEAVSRLFDEFSKNLSKSIEDSISEKIDELTSTLNLAEDAVEESTRKRLEETEDRLQEQIDKIQEDANKRIEELETELENERNAIDQRIQAIQAEADQEKDILQRKLTDLNEELEELKQKENAELSTAKESLAQAQVDIETREESYKEEITRKAEEYQQSLESKQTELNDLNTSLTEHQTEIESLKTQIEQKDAEITEQNSQLESLKEIMQESDEKHQRELAIKDQEVQRTIAMLTGVEGEKIDIPDVMRKSETAKAEADETRGQIKSLEAEIDKLVKLTQDEPQYQIFWHIRDASPKWITIKQLAASVGIPSVMVKRHLQRYEGIGLIELKGDKAKYILPYVKKVY